MFVISPKVLEILVKQQLSFVYPAFAGVIKTSQHKLEVLSMIRKERVARLAEELRKRGLDAVYLGPSTDLEYISGLDTHPDERVRRPHGRQ